MVTRPGQSRSPEKRGKIGRGGLSAPTRRLFTPDRRDTPDRHDSTMAIRPILSYPHPLLRRSAAEVVTFDADLRRLADDLVDTLRSVEALGITACHVGDLRRVDVLQTGGPDSLGIFVNPRLVQVSDERIRHPEGSVSLPGLINEVERAARVTVAFQDLEGQPATVSVEGLPAVCHQHEIDQLDGIFWLDRLSRLKRDRLLKRHRRQA